MIFLSGNWYPTAVMRSQSWKSWRWWANVRLARMKSWKWKSLSIQRIRRWSSGITVSVWQPMRWRNILLRLPSPELQIFLKNIRIKRMRTRLLAILVWAFIRLLWWPTAWRSRHVPTRQMQSRYTGSVMAIRNMPWRRGIRRPAVQRLLCIWMRTAWSLPMNTGPERYWINTVHLCRWRFSFPKRAVNRKLRMSKRKSLGIRIRWSNIISNRPRLRKRKMRTVQKKR